MKRLTFWQVCIGWLILTVVCYGINALTIRHALAQRCVMASLGVFLVARPVWPNAFGVYYDDQTCRAMIRGCGAVEILSSFLVRPFF